MLEITSVVFVTLLGVFTRDVDGFFVPGNSNGPQPYLTPPLQVSQIEATGWQMIFRATAGNSEDIYNAWTKGNTTIKGVGITETKPTDMARSYHSHYRDPRVMHWEALNIQYVKLALYKQSQEVAYVVFDGRNSDISSWFNGSRVEASSWSDLHRQNTFNYFSLQGHNSGNLERTFFINIHYGGCDSDLGHLVVVEHDGDCNWDHQPSYPQILYSDMNGADFWNRREFGRADYLAIFISTPEEVVIG